MYQLRDSFLYVGRASEFASIMSIGIAKAAVASTTSILQYVSQATFLLALVLLAGAIYFLKKYVQIPKFGDAGIDPPGPEGLPFFGNEFQIPQDKQWLRFHEWRQQYGILYIYHRKQYCFIFLVIRREYYQNKHYGTTNDHSKFSSSSF